MWYREPSNNSCSSETVKWLGASCPSHCWSTAVQTVCTASHSGFVSFPPDFGFSTDDTWAPSISHSKFQKVVVCVCGCWQTHLWAHEHSNLVHVTEMHHKCAHTSVPSGWRTRRHHRQLSRQCWEGSKFQTCSKTFSVRAHSDCALIAVEPLSLQLLLCHFHFSDPL